MVDIATGRRPRASDQTVSGTPGDSAPPMGTRSSGLGERSRTCSPTLSPSSTPAGHSTPARWRSSATASPCTGFGRPHQAPRRRLPTGSGSRHRGACALTRRRPAGGVLVPAGTPRPEPDARGAAPRGPPNRRADLRRFGSRHRVLGVPPQGGLLPADAASMVGVHESGVGSHTAVTAKVSQPPSMLAESRSGRISRRTGRASRTGKGMTPLRLAGEVSRRGRTGSARGGHGR